MDVANLSVTRAAGALGAEIDGIDLSGALSNSTVAAVRQALTDHQVVFFRNQDLDAPGLVRVARIFGEPNDYPFAKGLEEAPEVIEIIKAEADKRNFGGAWHSDSTYLSEPPAYTLLYALEVPSIGGDTLYASSYAAYDGLSDGMRDIVDDLTVVNSASLAGIGGRATLTSDNTAMARTNMDRADELEAEHPAAPVHPETGRRSIYINKPHSVRFTGMTAEESKPWIDYLAEQIPRPEHTCRMNWRAGTLGVWDNRCTQHFAINDYSGERRHMWRVTVSDGQGR